MWNVSRLDQAMFRGEGSPYGTEWTPFLAVTPVSAFYAEGSAVSVHPAGHFGMLSDDGAAA